MSREYRGVASDSISDNASLRQYEVKKKVVIADFYARTRAVAIKAGVRVSASEAKSLQSTISKQFSIFSNTNLQIGLFGQNTSKSSSINLSYDTANYSLMSATLAVDWVQDYSSGAEAQVLMNGSPELSSSWGAFDTSEKMPSTDVTGALQLGLNTFNITYKINYPALSTQTLVIKSLTLTIVLQYIGKGTPSPNPFTPTTGLSLTTLLTISILVAVGIAGVLSVFVFIPKRKIRERIATQSMR